MTEHGNIILERGTGKKKALYEQISDHIKENIKSGKLNPGEKLPPVSAMVGSWKVNYRTVNSALEQLDKEGFIKWEQRRGKQPVVLEKKQQENTFLYIRWGYDVLFFEMSKGILKFTKEKNIDCYLTDAYESGDKFLEILNASAVQVGGVLIVPVFIPGLKTALNTILNAGIKVVMLDRVINDINASSISVDHVGGAYAITNHLITSNLLPAYYIDYDEEHTSSTLERHKGWAIAMQMAGYLDTERYSRELSFSEGKEAKDANVSILRFTNILDNFLRTQKEFPINIFAANDHIAAGVYHAAEKLNLIIGKDIFLGGFGDYPLCRQFSVPLTSVKQNNERVGYEGAKLLYMEMKGLQKGPFNRKIPAELQIRASSHKNH